MADEEELRRNRQEDEFEALQSIYSGDVVDLRKSDAWQVRRPPEMLFSLRPQQSNTTTEAHARIDLYVKCPLAYPNVIPVIDLRNATGLPDRKVKDLKEQLIDIARTRVGEEMIYELCSHVESFLHDNNLPPRPSFYDEMINEKKRQKEERARQEETRHERQRQLEEIQLKELEKQLKRKEQERKENARKMREGGRQLSVDRRSAGDANPAISVDPSQFSRRPRSSLSPKSSETENQCNSRSTMISNAMEQETENHLERDGKAVTLKFSTDGERTIHRGKCIGGSARGSRVFAGMDAETGALVAVTQWEIRWSPAGATGPGNKENNLHAKYKGQVLSIEKEMLSLIRLSHSNLVLYLAINHETKQQSIKVNVLSEFAGGGNLGTSIQCRNPLPLDRIRSYTQQTLEGLAYLHAKSVVHRDLRLSSLLLDASGRVRIADYAIHKRLTDLVGDMERAKLRRETIGPTTDTNQSTFVKSETKKDDIYRLGLMTLSLAVGSTWTDLSVDLPSHLPTDFLDFLKRCGGVDEGLRWSSLQLLDHSFIKTPVYIDLSVNAGSFRSRSSAALKKQRPASSKAKEGENGDDVVDSLLLKSISSESRLKKEFKILRRIGKGGFGDVIKVRNLLDNRCYAIKRISLKPAWHKQYKKLTREVEVLSKLNHENIVRYFNSWLETCEDNSSSDDTSSSHTNTDSDTAADEEEEEEMSETPSYSSVESVIRRKAKTISQSLSESDLNEQVAPPSDDDDDVSSSDESSSSSDADVEDVFGQSRRWMSTQDSDDDDSIIFEENSKDNSESVESKVIPGSVKKNSCQLKTRTKKLPRKRQFLYIQMEFCEKSTLRDCIDKKNLYADVNRVWELFREIVEGLAHIHDQGIIHRDLKPVNIFLDSEYHVKIGDFGLATAFMDIVAEPSGVAADVPLKQRRNLVYEEEESSLTGKVGTVLYVSPEMESTTKRYNLKVDVYSLGIIFFEMCYRPFKTGMERIKVLTNIRKESIDFPDDFDEVCLPEQATIIRLLLNHDPFKRPSAKELLKSEYLPLSQMEESELYEVLDSTISNPEGRTYKHMLHRIFVQPVLTVTDFLYDADLFKASWTRNQALVQQTVAVTLERIFRHHGAIKLSVPLLMPTSSLYNNCCETYVTMMERSGGLISLPYDTMVPFARFIARAKAPHNFKRYSIERVFRECRPSGVHPRELWAASFDIVRIPSGALLDDVEVIYAVYEIIREFPVQSSCSYRLRINHASLLKAVLLHCGVSEDDCPQVTQLLSDSSMDRQIQRQKLLSIESVSEMSIDLIYSFLQREDVLDKMTSFLKSISKTKTLAASLTKKSLHEIETVIDHLNALGCTLQPLVSLSLLSNVRFFSGILFQVMLEGKRKKKATLGVLAAGGRYDNLVAMFRKPTERLSGCPQAVGVSIAFDKVVSLAVDSGHLDVQPLTEVLVCSIGCSSKREVLVAAQHFWDLGVGADIFQDAASQSLDNIKTHCHRNQIPYLLTLTTKDEQQKEWMLTKMQEDKERVLRKDKDVKEIANYFQERIRSVKGESSESNKQQTSSQAQSPSEPISTGGGGGGGGGGGIGGGGGGSNSVSTASCNVTFILPEGKDSNRLQRNTKRVYETQIYTAIDRTLPYLNPKSRVEVIATELPANLLKTLVAHFDVNKDEASLLSAIGVKEGQKVTSRKYISRVISEIKDNRSRLKPQTPIILYSLADEFHRVLLL